VSTTSTLRRRWKALELALAKRLGGERVPVSGRTRGWAPDVRHPWLAIEVKSRKAQLVVIAEMMDQAEKAAEFYRRRGEGARLPVGIYHVSGTRLDNAYVFMRLDDFEEHFGGATPREETA
jgi:Holliday junction resolvase